MRSQEHSGENNHSSSSVICPDCGDSGFCQVAGGVVVCGCRRPRQPNPPSPNRTSVAACSIPSNKAKTQRQRMLVLLKERGERGVTNAEFVLMKIFRYSSRLREIRLERNIVDTIRVRGGLYKYVFRAGPDVPTLLPVCESNKPAGVTPNLFSGAGQ